ncbi:hypothetical protein C1H87_02035 [Flavivirga eckloniae]|uniref:Carboxypeptidase-like regulatory domain-containing protein n=2 Tax=Flavivirga eckloniae TaxID=1803846 RepID=A0A2K9PKK5_9FLAO|nr:hypothetical protein C1H87_02035 [Flavivirga eckloniae]
MLSQNITGKVYDSETTVKGMKVFNLSNQNGTYTDNEGNFTIKATIGDTLSFHSIFHDKKIIKLTKFHFNDIIVIELSKTVNKLNEVLIQSDTKQKAFNQAKTEATINEQISNDIKSNPHLYGSSSKYGLDIVRVIGLIGKLLKKKNKKNSNVIPISHKSLDSLFSNSSFFNNELLSENLDIPKNYKNLFFDYCETKNLNEELLKNKNEMILLDSLITYSRSFLEIIEASKKK